MPFKWKSSKSRFFVQDLAAGRLPWTSFERSCIGDAGASSVGSDESGRRYRKLAALNEGDAFFHFASMLQQRTLHSVRASCSISSWRWRSSSVDRPPSSAKSSLSAKRMNASLAWCLWTTGAVRVVHFSPLRFFFTVSHLQRATFKSGSTSRWDRSCPKASRRLFLPGWLQWTRCSRSCSRIRNR